MTTGRNICKRCGKPTTVEGFDTCYSCMAGSLTINETRAMFGLPSIPEGDFIIVNHISNLPPKYVIVRYDPKPKRKVECDVSWA